MCSEAILISTSLCGLQVCSWDGCSQDLQLLNPASNTTWAALAVGETDILLHPLLFPVGVSISMEKESS